MSDCDPFADITEQATALFTNLERDTPVPGKTAVLFVDDEQSVLDGLRRMLRPMRREWDMRFANGSAEALRLLEEQPADVVVSDLRMPEMTGDVLLEQVKERWPGTIRLILSGDANRSQIFKTVGPAHQFLAKPCQPEDLKRAVAHAGAMRGVLTSKPLQNIIIRIENLPSLPAIYQDLSEELRGENVSMPRVAEIISRDPGMTMKILRMVNSAFFGLRRTVNAPEQAVNILGLETIHALVLSQQAVALFPVESGIDLELLAQHNEAVGSLTREVVRLEQADKDAIEQAFVTGLLHDIGRLILAANFTDQYRWLQEAAAAHQVPLHLAERKVFHADHGEVGAYLLGLWGLSDHIVEAVALHHRPSEQRGPPSLLLVALHVANHVDQRHRSMPTSGPVDRQALEAAGYQDRLRDWVACCSRMLQQTAGEEKDS
jgi:HD-like signal output (HDOD) protein